MGENRFFQSPHPVPPTLLLLKVEASKVELESIKTPDRPLLNGCFVFPDLYHFLGLLVYQVHPRERWKHRGFTVSLGHPHGVQNHFQISKNKAVR